jgi:hypothetical protein
VQLGVTNGGRNTEGYQENDVDAGTPEVDTTSAKVRGKNPRKHNEDHL